MATLEERVNKRAIEIGAFPAIDEFRQKGELTAETHSITYSLVFKVVQRRIAEAQKEIKRIETVPARVEAVRHEEP